MKLVKKLLVGAAVAVAAISMMSCGGLSGALQKTFGERDIFYYNDATYNSGAYGKWDIRAEENESSTEWVRCVKMLFTRHTDLTGKIDLDVRTSKNADGDGVLGIAFNVTKGKNSEGKTTWDFGVVGVANHGGEPKYYVSHFFNITDEDMAKQNFGAHDGKKAITKSAYDPNCDTPYELVVNDWTSLSGVYTQEGDGSGVPAGTISVIVQVKEDDDGNYVANFYKTEGYNGNANTDAEAIAGCALITSSNQMDANKINKTGARQAYVGVYGNIYCTKTLNGSMEIACLTNDAIIAY